MELFRNVPLIVQFFTRYLVIPELLPEDLGMWFKAELDPTPVLDCPSMLCLGLFTAARVCEQGAPPYSPAARAKNAALAMGRPSASGLPLRTAAERLPRHRSADDVRNDEPVKTRLSPQPLVW